MRIIKFHSRRSNAFSLVELLAVVATFAILGGIGILFIGSTKDSLEETKLQQDVAQINKSVKVFLGNGGSLEGIDTAQGVITELKKQATNSARVTNVGLTGDSVDNRLEAVSDSGGELRQRAVWNNTAKRFVLATTNTGVRQFRLNEALGAVDYGLADRDSTLKYNAQDGWVWESQDYTTADASGPNSLPILDVPTLGATDGSGNALNGRLSPPAIAPGSGIHALYEYPLKVTLTQPLSNPDNSTIIYSRGNNSWKRYTEPFSVEPNTTVTAYTTSPDPGWEESEHASSSFIIDPEALEVALYTPINPVSYAEAGGPLLPGNYTPLTPLEPIMVTLPNGWKIPDLYEDSAQFQFYWSMDGSYPLTAADSVKGIKFKKGYRNNNGHGNNADGVDSSNPGQGGGGPNGAVDLSGDVDDELKQHDRISYTIDNWNGAELLPIRVVAESKNQSMLSTSLEVGTDIRIRRTNLRSPRIEFEEDPSAGDTVELLLEVDFGDMPAGTRIYYTTDGTDPGDDGTGNPLRGTRYTGSFDPLLDEEDSSGEAMITARAYPPVDYMGWFDVSQPTSSFYLAPLWDIDGTAVGSISGDGDFAGSVYTSISGNTFEWSEGSVFEGVSNRERFKIGEMSFHNGRGYVAGEIDPFNLSLDLDFLTTSQTFDFQIGEYVTYNTSDAWESADYIFFANSDYTQTVNLYGTDYRLDVEFEALTELTDSLSSDFRVQEGVTGTAAVYGTLMALESWWFIGE